MNSRSNGIIAASSPSNFGDRSRFGDKGIRVVGKQLDNVRVEVRVREVFDHLGARVHRRESIHLVLSDNRDLQMQQAYPAGKRTANQTQLAYLPESESSEIVFVNS